MAKLYTMDHVVIGHDMRFISGNFKITKFMEKIISSSLVIGKLRVHATFHKMSVGLRS